VNREEDPVLPTPAFLGMQHWSTGKCRLDTHHSITPSLHYSSSNRLPRSGHFFRAQSRTKPTQLSIDFCAKWQEVFRSGRFSP
jgi:hypothetical protein